MKNNNRNLNLGIETYVTIFEDAYKKNLEGREPDTLYKPIIDLLGRGGKRLRPSLCLMACELAGGEIKKAMPTAIGIEFFHNFSLAHDDIEDNSPLRRGEPALHVKYGVPIAVNAGDGLYALCYEALKENKGLLGVERAWKIFEELAELCVVLAEGQAMDLAFKDGRRMSESEVIETLRKKTAKLFAVSAKCGAIAGGAPYDTAEDLGSAWEDIGIAFQIRDDILNVVGEEEKYGKRIGEDIAEGKPTLLLINCLEHCEAREKEKIYECFRNYDKAKIEEVVNLFRKYGSIDYSEEIAMRYLRGGTDKIRRINIKDEAEGKSKKGEEIKEKMVALAEYFVERER
ncbi:MAG: polyprenyl synthetase family protein [Methanophagales archaeon]|nr:polyprenyl synthetase family protein [Methanophagales archaeon]MCW3141374.1 polyprenyl synthetase family protein [Methanophagales archaeon]